MYTHAQRDYTSSTIFAFDKSEARSRLLSDRMDAAGEFYRCAGLVWLLT